MMQAAFIFWEVPSVFVKRFLRQVVWSTAKRECQQRAMLLHRLKVLLERGSYRQLPFSKAWER